VALAFPTFFAVADDPVPTPDCANAHANESVYDAGNMGNIQGVHSQVNSTQFSDQQCESIRSVLAYGKPIPRT
jgi:hypothetical protein